MRYFLVILAFAMIIVPGIGHGLLTDRWFVSKDLEEFTARLAKIPMDIQDWQGEDVAIDPRQIARANLSGYVARRFTHKTTGTQIRVMVGCGLPGPVSVHSPDICYQGSGYDQSTPITTFSTSSGSSKTEEFHETTYMKSKPVPESVELYWSWNCKGNWEIPANPRVAFGGHKALYKLYVICPFSQDGREVAKTASKKFLDVFLPELRKSLF